MKCSELYRILLKAGWYPISQRGSHVKLKHSTKTNLIIFPNHGSQEIGKGLELKIFKEAGINKKSK
ncbi:MAG: type II toxin-antitoxin system HicA family toxin [Saprospiraceae bacterium]|nr:type II toxin-antitoxin system HicA family toxin [Saprospiraceae bacterium]